MTVVLAGLLAGGGVEGSLTSASGSTGASSNLLVTAGEGSASGTC